MLVCKLFYLLKQIKYIKLTLLKIFGSLEGESPRGFSRAQKPKLN